MDNKIMLQGFEWYLPDDGIHWKRVSHQASYLKEIGIDMLWLPPAYKGAGGTKSVGYDVYDKYDLGEFDQKGAVRTKYGTKEEYLSCIQHLQSEGIQVIADIVLDHLMGADQTEEVTVVEDSFDDRNQQISDEKIIHAWTGFTFSGRAQKYSDETWDYTDFKGTDWDEAAGTSGLYRMENKTWNPETDWEKGNFDYLMGACLDMDNPDVVRKVTDWGYWYLDETGCDGLRLDAVKHISHDFFKKWVSQMRARRGEDFFVVGEYWSGEIERLLHYLDAIENQYALFDSPLHYAFFNAASNPDYDMRNLLNGSLLRARPDNAVTFVDNHDTQPGQALESFIPSWFKTQAYAAILFQEMSTPCLFYGDLFGIPYSHVTPVLNLDKMCKARKIAAYGTQMDYYDDPHVVGYTRSGDSQHSGSGMAILFTNAGGGKKRMYVSMKYAGEEFINLLQPNDPTVLVGADGCGEFYVSDSTAAIWIRKEAYKAIEVK